MNTTNTTQAAPKKPGNEKEAKGNNRKAKYARQVERTTRNKLRRESRKVRRVNYKRNQRMTHGWEVSRVAQGKFLVASTESGSNILVDDEVEFFPTFGAAYKAAREYGLSANLCANNR